MVDEVAAIDARPPTWDSWPREARIEYLEMARTRVGLMREALALASHEPARKLDSRSRLTKTELSAIVLAMGGQT